MFKQRGQLNEKKERKGRVTRAKTSKGVKKQPRRYQKGGGRVFGGGLLGGRKKGEKNHSKKKKLTEEEYIPLKKGSKVDGAVGGHTKRLRGGRDKRVKVR